jgi:2-methylcitrate dehydratase
MQTLLIALVKAYEIQGCYQMQNAFNAYGIDHVVLVKLASAAVVSWLVGLSEEQTMATVSHVWMDGHPSRVYRAGTNTIPRKGWAAGDAARKAVQLALMVEQGQPGSPGALSAKPGGFWERTFGETGFKLPRPFGSWTVQNVLFKIVPVEGHAISAVEAAMLHAQLLQKKELSQIKWIDLRTTAAANLIVNKHGKLRNSADRDHCIQYVVALTFLKKSPPEAADYSDKSPWATSEELRSLRERIEVRPDSKLTQDYFDLGKKSIGAGMTVHLADGSAMPEILVEYPVGHARNPQTPAAVQKKFFQNMGQMFSAAKIGCILGAVQQPDLPVSDFVNLLVPTRKARL